MNGKAPYTGPTGITKTERGIEIEGYPDAAYLVALRSEIGKRLAALRLHQSTLMFCEKAMQTFGVVRKADMAITGEAMLTGIVARYFSCFGKNNAGHSLSSDRVFKSMPDAKDCYDYWKALRDKSLVHNESEFTVSKSAVILGKDGEVQDIFSFAASFSIASDDDHVQLLYKLIDHTLKHVIAEIDALLPRAFEEVRAMTPAQRLALPTVQYEKATPEKATITRTWM